MSCEAKDDLDVFVIIRKLDGDGIEMLALNIPWSTAKVSKMSELQAKDVSDIVLYPGSVGMLRASHREIDCKKSMHEQYPFYPHDRDLKVPPGEVFELEIGLWAMGIEYEAGESLEVQVSGALPTIEAFGPLKESPKNAGDQGRHKIHFSKKHPSRVVLPFIS